MNPFVMAVVAAAIFVAGGLAAHATVDAAQLASARLETSDLRGQVETNRANANQATIDGIQRALADTLAAEAAARAEDQARARRLANFLEVLSHVADSKNCAGSPAFRVLIDSVRNEAPGSHK